MRFLTENGPRRAFSDDLFKCSAVRLPQPLFRQCESDAMYCIDTTNLELRLEIVPVKSLVPHEEIIPDAAKGLILEFSNWTNLQNPVIVDENHMVLDGHHRFFVFKALNFKYIPVCRINYLNESVQLRYWFRALRRAGGPNGVRAIIEEMKGSLQSVDDRKTLKKVLKESPLSWGIQVIDSFTMVTFPEDKAWDAVSAYDVLEQFQRKLIQKGVDITYIPCQNLTECDPVDASACGEMVLWTPQITKEMVVSAVRQGKKFAPKATRHLVPARPINVDVPTRWLKEEISMEEINQRFTELLKRKGIRRFGPGQIVNGRYYEEELFVFYDEGKKEPDEREG